jgi:hypothetical protein
MTTEHIPTEIWRAIGEYAIEIRIAGLAPPRCVFRTRQHRELVEDVMGKALRCHRWSPYTGGFIKFVAKLPTEEERYLVVTAIPERLSACDERLYKECCRSFGVQPQLWAVGGVTHTWRGNALVARHFWDRYYVHPYGTVCIP